MRKSLIMSAVALTAVFAGCTKTEVTSSEVANGQVIGFSTYAIGTKGAYPEAISATGDLDNTSILSQSFGVVGYKQDNSLYLGSATKAAKQTYNSTLNSWEYADATELRFWPAGDMDFFAYCPYGDSAAEFLSSDASGNVMTIKSWTDGDDVLYAVKKVGYLARVPLTFHHAFAKIKQVDVKTDGDVKNSGITITIESVEFLNTANKGTVAVAADGTTVTYTPSADATARKVSPATAVEVTSTNKSLITNDNKAYIFPSGSTTLWNGNKSSIASGKTLATDSQIVMHLSAKAAQGSTYILGTDSTYGDLYIPITGAIDGASPAANLSTLEVGKRYTFNITMKDNIGYDVNGDPILKPIKFSVESVDAWADVTVNITL